MNIESAVLDRYKEGAREVQPLLCCPVSYDKELLSMLPEEVVAKDYGCGDPSQYVRPGDVVLDLGSGSGKICYMAAHLTGENGAVIGVDMNDEMLALARKYQPEMAEKLGGDRVKFVKGKIQDLALDVAAMETWLADNPVSDADSLAALDRWTEVQRKTNPLIKDNSVDLIVSNCVLNLVSDGLKRQLVQEIFRVLKPGGRVAISDIVSDKFVPEHLKQDPELWSGCISGAFQEKEMIDEFIQAGFQAVSIDKWSNEPWQVVEDIEFRSITLTAVKPEIEKSTEKKCNVMYKGPFKQVEDDAGNVYTRGQRVKVTEATYHTLINNVYADAFINLEEDISSDEACCAPVVKSDSGCCG